MESVNYESHSIEYACMSCQKCLSCPCVSMPIIWNTVAVNKCCHIRITAILYQDAPIQASLPCCMKSVHYESYPIEYTCRLCQTYLSCTFGSIPIIWNTVAANKCCHTRITAVFTLKPPVQAIVACCMEIVPYGSYPIEYACRSCQIFLPCPCVSIPIIWNTVAVNKCCHMHISAISHHIAPCSR